MNKKTTNLKLTEAEEKAMKILWSLSKGMIRDVVDKYEEPKPAYTTVATIFKILETKGFVGRRPIGNTHEYYPRIERTQYTSVYIKSFLKNYFSDSFKRLVSEFSNTGELTTQEMEELIEHLKENIRNNKKK